MIRYAAFFFILAIISAVFGFSGIALYGAVVAKVLFYIFIMLFLILIVFGATYFKK